ncbi:flavin reductase [Sinomonas sp. JGH33]|uniref:Flavin reductase n=1 Tax=Sinomonas terricola TaxID=3110330 RepID=A0ABU5TAQ6_9MICC|nr:flavin reductase [Sinomonas sp. JGH33]MEA5456781.1 flavin reductase [Sinomonas sp. JGH33]
MNQNSQNALGTSPADPQWFRQVLGRYPTGVALISSAEADGTPVGMVVGTFTSVSLDPPLVAFLPARTSTTWPRIRATGRFAVNVLGAGQEDVCRAFSSKTGSKYENVPWHPSVSGTPFLERSVAWLDCTIEDVMDAGDHEIVLGRVDTMDIASPDLPLLFFQGGYGRFTPHSMAVAGPDLARELALVDSARLSMEALAGRLGCDCLAGARVRDEFVLLASAGPGRTEWIPSVVGRRVTAAAPFGRTAMAWAEDADIERWIAASETLTRPEAYALLDRIRARGYSVSVGAGEFGPTTPPSAVRDVMDPGAEALGARAEAKVHSISAPVFGPDGTAVLVLSLYGLPPELDADGVERCAAELLAAARHISGAAAYQAL